MTEILAALIEGLHSSSRRERQACATRLGLICQEEPELLTPYIDEFVKALNCPEAQTRWECLDILSVMVGLESRLCDKAIPGAEGALFDETSGPLRLSAMRFLCTLGATTENRSLKTWELIDEAIQCYHGDPEFPDMLVAVTALSEGKLAPAVKDALKERMTFDAHNAKGALKRRAQVILDNVSK